MVKTYHIEGAGEIRAKLEELGKRGALKVGRAAMRKAARAILVEARAAAPVESGRLKRQLTVKVDRGRRDKSAIFATVKVKGPPKYRPRTTENETTRHGKKSGRSLDYQVGSTPEVYGAFQEFGAPARNIAPKGYMRRAWDSEGGIKAIDRIGKELGEGLEREAAHPGSYGFEIVTDGDEG